MIKSWFKSGKPWIWLNAAAVSTCLIMVIGILGLVTFRGIGHFWPGEVGRFVYESDNGQPVTFFAEKVDSTVTSWAAAKSAGYKMADNEDALIQYQLKTGNRDITGTDFRWIQKRRIKEQSYPDDLMTIERREWGNFYGQLAEVKDNGKVIASGEQAWPILQEKIAESLALFKTIHQLEKKEIGAVNYGLERLRLKQKKLELENLWNEAAKKELAAEKVVR